MLFRTLGESGRGHREHPRQYTLSHQVRMIVSVRAIHTIVKIIAYTKILGTIAIVLRMLLGSKNRTPHAIL